MLQGLKNEETDSVNKALAMSAVTMFEALNLKLVKPAKLSELLTVTVTVPVFPLKSKVGSFATMTCGVIPPPLADHSKTSPELVTAKGDQVALVEVVVITMVLPPPPGARVVA